MANSKRAVPGIEGVVGGGAEGGGAEGGGGEGGGGISPYVTVLGSEPP